MEHKVSKAQIAVWEWKEKAYESLKHLPISEQMRRIHEQTKQTVTQIKKRQKAARTSASTQIVKQV
ncbi:MAG: hypothetical protein IPM98_18885 [Lewinellaceae bacterium]|nr:hypothetical protein [Lewinellaceae bacterium]